MDNTLLGIGLPPDLLKSDIVGVKEGKMTGRTDLRGRGCGWGYFLKYLYALFLT